MEEDPKQAAFISALTTEHFVLQSAASSTISEAAARSSLYVFSLSSTLVAMGFAASTPTVFMAFVAAALPAVFLLGIFTVVRLVDTALENMQYLAGIARVRSQYRKISPEAMTYFIPESGRWPEEPMPPSQGLGPFIALFGTTATMIAFINNFVAGAIVTLGVVALSDRDGIPFAVGCGVAAAVVLSVVFLMYQRWRFNTIDLAMRPETKAVTTKVQEAGHDN